MQIRIPGKVSGRKEIREGSRKEGGGLYSH